MPQHHNNLSNQFGNSGGNTGGMSRSQQVAGMRKNQNLKNIFKSILFTGLNSIGSSLSNYSSVAGIQPYVLQQLGIEGPVTNKVFVANVSELYFDVYFE
jgi:hypothetical protein